MCSVSSLSVGAPDGPSQSKGTVESCMRKCKCNRYSLLGVEEIGGADLLQCGLKWGDIGFDTLKNSTSHALLIRGASQ